MVNFAPFLAKVWFSEKWSLLSRVAEKSSPTLIPSLGLRHIRKRPRCLSWREKARAQRW